MNLESYIKKNRSGLDVEKPDEEYLWTGISQAMSATPKRKYMRVLRFAAAAALLTLSLGVAFFLGRRDDQHLLLVSVDPKLADQEVRFKHQIETYTKRIRQTAYDASQLATSSSEIQYLDDLINYYSRDLAQNGPNPKLINSLMDLYRKKIMLLERMLNEIEKSKNHEKRKIDI